METMTCPKCSMDKDIFAFKRAKRNSTEIICESCYVRQFPSQTPAKTLERVYRTRKRNRDYVLSYLLEHPCLDCGEQDPIVLEFDHVRGEKASNVSILIHNTASIKRIQNEIDKCDVVCANCHRRRTAITQDWDKGLVAV